MPLTRKLPRRISIERLTATPRTDLHNASHQKVAQRDPHAERLGEADILEPQPRPDLEPKHE